MKHFTKMTLAVALSLVGSTAAMGLPRTEDEFPYESIQEQDSTCTLNDSPKQNPATQLYEKVTGKEAPKWLEDVSSRIKLHGYIQGGYSYSHHGGESENTFLFKRAIVWAEAQITDRWSFRFMHNFAGPVLEYYTDYRITKNKALTVRLGQFKNGLSLENPLSPSAMEAIDAYSEAVNYLASVSTDPLAGSQSGRDLGLSVFGETNNGKFRYEVQVMNGQGINKKDGNKFKDIIARLEYRPVEGLNIVASGQRGRGHAIATSVYNPGINIDQDYTRNRCTIGAEYKSRAFNVHGEYLNGWDGDVHSWGAYVTGSVPLARFGKPEYGKKLELVASYDFFNYNTTLGYDQHKAIGGLQYWFFKRCRLQVQYVYKNAFIKDDVFHHGANHNVLCQMQVRFN